MVLTTADDCKFLLFKEVHLLETSQHAIYVSFTDDGGIDTNIC